MNIALLNYYMKKKCFLSGAVCIACAYITVKANFTNHVATTDLLIQNIEALAAGEGEGGTITCSGGDRICAEAYDESSNKIATLYMP